VEEHQINGGLGSAIAQLLAKTNPVPMEFVGLADTFGESGEPEELLNKYGLSVSDIVHSAKKAIKRK
jgi:transketolase